MTAKYRGIYLYLALACFVGIVLIFVFDGYMGVYDRLLMDNGRYPQVVEPDQWANWNDERYYMSMGVSRGGVLDFTYTLENHRFSAYRAQVNVSLWYAQKKLLELVNTEISASAFGSGKLTWSFAAADVLPADYPASEVYNITMVIRRGDVERRVRLFVEPSPYPAGKVPAPVD